MKGANNKQTVRVVCSWSQTNTRKLFCKFKAKTGNISLAVDDDDGAAAADTGTYDDGNWCISKQIKNWMGNGEWNITDGAGVNAIKATRQMFNTDDTLGTLKTNK